MKRRIIANLLLAGRVDLANVVAYRVGAKIVLPPRKTGPFVKSFIKRLLQLDKLLQRLDKRFDELENNAQHGDLTSDINIEEADVDGYDVKRLFTMLKGYGGKSKLDKTADLLDLGLQVLGLAEDAHERLRRLGELADRFQSLFDDLNRIAGNNRVMKLRGTGWIKPTLQEYEKWVVSPGWKGKVDYLNERDLKLLSQLVTGLSELMVLSSEAADRIRMRVTQAIEKYRDTDWKPPMESVERMYHASVDAKAIGRKGFDATVPSTKGLGGSQSDKKFKGAVSFTSDLYVAKEVMRSLKEAIMISRGELKSHDILEWADKAGIKDKVLDSAFMPSRERGSDDPAVVFAYYMQYLASSKRYDPGYFGVPEKFVKIFKPLNVRNVGVIVAQVNTKHPDIVYLPAMQEYRVPPEAVLKIEKVIKG